ncbi:MAG: ribosome assembly factor SBDS [archaeon]
MKTFSKERVHLNLARYRHGGRNYEVAVDPDAALALRAGKDVDIASVLKSDNIFYDVQKGLLASEKELAEIFGSDEHAAVARKIISEGEVQLTSEYRAKLREEKRRSIIGIIHRNGVDPRTHAPHPVQRIENAFEEAKVRIDEFQSAEDQVPKIISQLRVVLPINFETKVIEVTIPAEYAPKSYSALGTYGRLKSQDWLSDGSLLATVEIPAGLETEFYSKLNSITHGNIETKVR